MIKIILVILFSFFVLSCNKREKETIEIFVEKKQQLNNHCLLIKLIIKNNTKENYLVPITPIFFLDNSKKKLQSIPSQIITSDFTINLDDRQEFLLQEFTKKKLYKGFSRQAYKMAILKNYEEYSNSLFFIPKNSKRELFLTFNDYTSKNDIHNSNEIFSAEFTKIRIDKYGKEDFKTIDSLINYNKLNYILYRGDIYFNDSLYINK